MASDDNQIFQTAEMEGFQFFDQKGLGTVTPDDVINAIERARTHLPVNSLQALQESGEWKKDLDVMMSEFDADLDGRLTLVEFNTFIEKGSRKETEQLEGMDLVTKQLKEVFDMFDTDKDGFIDKKDLKIVLSCMEGREVDEGDVGEMVGKISTEGESVSFADFTNLFKKEAELETDDIVDLILNDYDL